MNRFLKTFLTYFIVIFVLINVLALLSFWTLRHGNFYKPSFALHSLQKTDFDYIIIGSSIGLTTLDTRIIDSITSLKGLNLSMDDTSMPSHFLMLEHILKSGKKPALIILAPNPFDYQVLENRISVNDYRYLMFSNQDYVKDYFHSFEGSNAAILKSSSLLPAIPLVYYNSEIFFPSILSFLNQKKRIRFDEHGNYFYPLSTNTPIKESRRNFQDLEFLNPWVGRINKLCDAYDINIVYYVSPVSNTTIRVNDTIKNIINDSGLIEESNYFYDELHVNKTGREVASKSFANKWKITVLIE